MYKLVSSFVKINVLFIFHRMFSDYFFHGLGNMSTEAFHKQVVYSIKLLHECTRTSTLRACLYNRKLIVGLTVSLHANRQLPYLFV